MCKGSYTWRMKFQKFKERSLASLMSGQKNKKARESHCQVWKKRRTCRKIKRYFLTDFLLFPLLLFSPFIHETTGSCVSFVPIVCSSLSAFSSPLRYKTSIIPARAYESFSVPTGASCLSTNAMHYRCCLQRICCIQKIVTSVYRYVHFRLMKVMV